MYGEILKQKASNFANVEITAWTKPHTMPLNSDDIDGIPDGIKLAPGSYLLETTTGTAYEYVWDEL